ncbi:hypothetical protein [Nocardia beijingensis]
MSENPDLRDRPDPLPSMDRLLRVWDGVEKSTSSLEHATRAFLTVWILQFEGIDLRTVEDWRFTDHQAAVREKAVVLTRAIDDEVTWHLGNRPELVTLVDDDADAPTVGELLGQITMYAALSTNGLPAAARSRSLPRSWCSAASTTRSSRTW